MATDNKTKLFGFILVVAILLLIVGAVMLGIGINKANKKKGGMPTLLTRFQKL